MTMTLTDAEFRAVLGDELHGSLSTPLGFFLPTGLVTILGLIAALVAWACFWPTRQNRLLKLKSDLEEQQKKAKRPTES